MFSRLVAWWNRHHATWGKTPKEMCASCSLGYGVPHMCWYPGNCLCDDVGNHSLEVG